MRIFFYSILGIIFSLAAIILAINYLASGSFYKHETLPPQLSYSAKMLINEAFEDINEEWIDYHVHLIGEGDPENAFLHPDARSPIHPLRFIRYIFFKKAIKVNTLASTNADYLAGLTKLILNFPKPGKAYLFAMDKFFHTDGSSDLDLTEFYVSNEYLFKVTQKNPNLFVPVVSIHPYQENAISQIIKWYQNGVRYVKWIPNAMGIQPNDPKLDPFFQTLKALDMVLITHGGIERAVIANTHQHLGNPLLLRRALDQGVKVIIAHGASLGRCDDLEHPDVGQVDCFDLFMRLMDDPKYKYNLFGDISAVTQSNRKLKVIETLLAREDLHDRFVNGSDYPVPAINMLINTNNFVQHALITKDQAKALKEIYQYNPLLYDFVLKRTLRLPDKGQKFSANIFIKNPQLPEGGKT